MRQTWLYDSRLCLSYHPSLCSVTPLTFPWQQLEVQCEPSLFLFSNVGKEVWGNVRFVQSSALKIQKWIRDCAACWSSCHRVFVFFPKGDKEGPKKVGEGHQLQTVASASPLQFKRKDECACQSPSPPSSYQLKCLQSSREDHAH